VSLRREKSPSGRRAGKTTKRDEETEGSTEGIAGSRCDVASLCRCVVKSRREETFAVSDGSKAGILPRINTNEKITNRGISTLLILCTI
jgi:hypothetical protein